MAREGLVDDLIHRTQTAAPAQEAPQAEVKTQPNSVTINYEDELSGGITLEL